MRKSLIVMQKSEVIYRVSIDKKSYQITTTKWEEKMVESEDP